MEKAVLLLDPVCLRDLGLADVEGGDPVKVLHERGRGLAGAAANVQGQIEGRGAALALGKEFDGYRRLCFADIMMAEPKILTFL